MKIFSDQPLRESPHIAVFSSAKVGNFVVTTPLLRGLKEKYPNCNIDFFGSEVTKDFEENCSYIDWRFSLYIDSIDFLEVFAKAVQQRRQEAGVYDLAINCDQFSEINLVMVTAIRPIYVAGGALSEDFRYRLSTKKDPIQKILADSDWNSQKFLTRHSNILQNNYISEIFCLIAYIKTNFFKLELPTKLPDFSVPDILLSITATRSAKMWLADYWIQVTNWCQEQGLSVGLIGNKPEIQRDLYYGKDIEAKLLSHKRVIDLRGKTSLTELAGALCQAKACIAVDSGPLHIAAAVGCPTVAIFGNDIDGDGASPIRLWLPRQPYVKLAFSQFKCTLCQDNKYENLDCCMDTHRCMIDVDPRTVINNLKELLKC